MAVKFFLALALSLAPAAAALAEDAAPIEAKKEEKKSAKAKKGEKKEESAPTPARCLDKKGVEFNPKKNEKTCKATVGATWVPAKAGMPPDSPK